MDKSILGRLYNGELYPSEDILPNSAEYRAMSHAINDEKQYFQGKLSESDLQRYEKMEELIHEADDIYCYENFLCGFRLGAGLMIEILMNA